MSQTAREVIQDYLASDANPNEATASDLIAALDAEGFVIVPKEPTEAMVNAPRDAEVIVGPSPGCFIDPDEAKEIYGTR